MADALCMPAPAAPAHVDRWPVIPFAFRTAQPHPQRLNSGL